MSKSFIKKAVVITMLGVLVFLMLSCCVDIFATHSLVSSGHMAANGCGTMIMGSMSHDQDCSSMAATSAIKLSSIVFISFSVLAAIFCLLVLSLGQKTDNDQEQFETLQFWRYHFDFSPWIERFSLGVVHPKIY